MTLDNSLERSVTEDCSAEGNTTWLPLGGAFGMVGESEAFGRMTLRATLEEEAGV